jgi:hypothetical protein
LWLLLWRRSHLVGAPRDAAPLAEERKRRAALLLVDHSSSGLLQSAGWHNAGAGRRATGQILGGVAPGLSASAAGCERDHAASMLASTRPKGSAPGFTSSRQARAAPRRLIPVPGCLIAEGFDRLDVAAHGAVAEVSSRCRAEPLALFGDRQVHAPPTLGPDLRVPVARGRRESGGSLRGHGTLRRAGEPQRQKLDFRISEASSESISPATMAARKPEATGGLLAMLPSKSRT